MHRLTSTNVGIERGSFQTSIYCVTYRFLKVDGDEGPTDTTMFWELQILVNSMSTSAEVV